MRNFVPGRSTARAYGRQPRRHWQPSKEASRANEERRKIEEENQSRLAAIFGVEPQTPKQQ